MSLNGIERCFKCILCRQKLIGHSLDVKTQAAHTGACVGILLAPGPCYCSFACKKERGVLSRCILWVALSAFDRTQ